MKDNAPQKSPIDLAGHLEEAKYNIAKLSEDIGRLKSKTKGEYKYLLDKFKIAEDHLRLTKKQLQSKMRENIN